MTGTISCYLSPSFSRRDRDQTDFLYQVDGSTGFSLFWIDVVKPILLLMKADHLLEIGADRGEHTQLLLEYCESADASLTIVEPFVCCALRTRIGDSERVKLLEKRSCDAIVHIENPVDTVLLEGDLNYHTVLGDLTAIEGLAERFQSAFPVVFLRSTSWPYARRDMYYDPDSIPSTDRRDYAKSGVTPWTAETQGGMINSPFANAMTEGGLRNGVLTAAEDFLKRSKLPLRLFSLPINNGLGIICLKESDTEGFIDDKLSPPPALGLLLQTCELARINQVLRSLEACQIKQNGRMRRVMTRLKRYLAETFGV